MFSFTALNNKLYPGNIQARSRLEDFCQVTQSFVALNVTVIQASSFLPPLIVCATFYTTNI